MTAQSEPGSLADRLAVSMWPIAPTRLTVSP